MSKGINKCHFMGNLGKNPERGMTKNGKAVANFSIACTERFKSATGWGEHTEWVSIVTYDKLAEHCLEFLQQGALIYVEGRMQTRKWIATNKEPKYATEIIARDIRFVSGVKSKKQIREDAGAYHDDSEDPY